MQNLNLGTNMVVKFDKKTNREYVSVNSTENYEFSADALDRNNLLIATFNNSARVMTNSGTLVLFENQNPVELYRMLANNKTQADELNSNFIKFYAWASHAVFEIYCRSCDNGKPLHIFVDMIGEVKVSEDPTTAFLFDYFSSPNPKFGWYQPPSISRTNSETNTTTTMNIQDFDTLKFHLTNDQVLQVNNSIERIIQLQKKESYSYVNWSHDCVSLLTDIYRYSGFPRHFSEFLQDDELFLSKKFDVDTSGKAYLHRYDDFSYKHDPKRKSVSEYMRDTEGENFGQNWYSGIHNKVVDKSKLSKYPQVLERYNEAQESNNKILPLLISEILKKFKINLSEKNLQTLLDFALPVRNFDLYYFQTAEQIYEIFVKYKDSPVFDQLFEHGGTYYGLGMIKSRCENSVDSKEKAQINLDECNKQLFDFEQYQLANPFHLTCRKSDGSEIYKCSYNQVNPLTQDEKELCLALKFECGRPTENYEM